MVIEAHSRVTLERLALMARMLYRLRGLIFVAGVAAGVWLAIVILSPDAASETALVPISLLLWAAVGLGVAYTLPEPPPRVLSGDPWPLRARKRVSQAGYLLAVISMLALGTIALFWSLRAVKLIIE
jgi:hypothetical protein